MPASTFTPQNPAIYLAACGGAVAGLGAAGKQSLAFASNPGNFWAACQQAELFAEEVDVQWATLASGATPSTFQLSEISSISEAIWTNPSPLLSNNTSAGAYFEIAVQVVNLAREGQVALSPHVNPFTPTNVAPSTTATVIGNQTYQVKPTDAVILLDTSNGLGTATAVLPNPTDPTNPYTPYINEEHTLVWFAWNVGQTLPTIKAGGTQKMMPFEGMTISGNSGLVTSTNIRQVGEFITYKWDGTKWVQAG